jgi:sulfofructosephosphate aldolase
LTHPQESAVPVPTTAATDVLRDARGAFSMLAIDQRGSLREMLSAGRADAVDDDAVVRFKIAVVRSLSPFASAVLVDRQFGADAAAAAACPVILAADLLSQSVPGAPVDRAALDEQVDAEVVARFGAKALKMLVPWTPDTRAHSIELSGRFMELCRRLGLPGIVEGVVRPADLASWSDAERDDAIAVTAADLGSTGPDLYKGEVPSYGLADHDATVTAARRITDSLDCPWVVLSSGVTAARFPAAVAACREAGASGFLAGRAIWADAITAEDQDGFLRSTSVERLKRLSGALP